MADASDSKSDVGDYVWVQVPSPALKGAKQNTSGSGFAPFCATKDVKQSGDSSCFTSFLESPSSVKRVAAI